MIIATWKKNGLRLRVLAKIEGRSGETRFLVQKETAQGMHGLFSVKTEELEPLESASCAP